MSCSLLNTYLSLCLLGSLSDQPGPSLQLLSLTLDWIILPSPLKVPPYLPTPRCWTVQRPLAPQLPTRRLECRAVPTVSSPSCPGRILLRKWWSVDSTTLRCAATASEISELTFPSQMELGQRSKWHNPRSDPAPVSESQKDMTRVEFFQLHSPATRSKISSDSQWSESPPILINGVCREVLVLLEGRGECLISLLKGSTMANFLLWIWPNTSDDKPVPASVSVAFWVPRGIDLKMQNMCRGCSI